MSQANGFSFSTGNAKQAKVIIARYPDGRQQSAVMPLLDLAQRQNDGWLSPAAIDYIAEMLAMPGIRVFEVASFYTMYNLAPVGKHLIGVCTTTPCWLCGSDDVVATCRAVLGIELGQTTDDGLFTLTEVECAGACCNAPMMQIGDAYYEDLDAASTRAVLEAFQRGETPKPGSQTGRCTSEPAGGLTSLVASQSPQES